ncbi:hypothetical protein CRG98_046900 [Punica granatum]|uniref:Uncharacterized protein n=1 Tax=Punica granatum TaxID=22663 RepID=A0A2I0HN73_PUNGR|nr:hypothetical protein CRG98_046900 [Punica granatum]
MARDGFFRISCSLAFMFMLINSILCSAQDDKRKVYIVYMGSVPTETSGIYSPTAHHLSLLQDIFGDESSASTSIVRSYKRSFNGFAARLTEQEAQKLANLTAVDDSGHGTHTASTAAGSPVEGASFFGLANGTARGAVPSSRIAVYKVCDSTGGCDGYGILAAFDDAIADGVDIITVSLGGDTPSPIDQDPISIGSFHAMKKGILVTHSAGNSGPMPQTVTSVAPWVLTVAANSIDRKFITKLVLGDGTVLTGIAVNSFPSSPTNSALVFGEQVSSSCDEASARTCTEGCLDRQKVTGKIVICEGSKGAPEAATYNASGIILMTMRPDVASPFPLPAVALDDSSFEKLVSYHSSTRNPQGRILKGETVPDPASPVTASFSSRGPSVMTPDIMKPFKLALNRTVTNVGPPTSTYKAKAVSASNVNITVVPEVISFKSISEKKSFMVIISGSGLKSGTQLSEEVLWSDGVHSVRSPIIVYN